MIDTTYEARDGLCPIRGDGQENCTAADCMAWRTVDGNLEHGFCGMVPVLPYQLRVSNPEDLGQKCLHGAGPEIIGQPGLPGSAS